MADLAQELTREFGSVVEVVPLTDHDGRSGARLDRLRLEDGTSLVVKYSDPATDLTIALGGAVQRERELWETGVLDRLPAGVTHPILAVGEQDGLTVTVMRDLGEAVLGWDRVLDAAEVGRVLDALCAMHDTFAGAPPASALAVGDRLGLLSPDRLARVGDHPLEPLVRRGWARFADLVDADIVAAVTALHRDPTPLAVALGAGPQTLLHGDLWLVNLALLPDEVVFLDWAVATAGPAALDLAVFLGGATANVEPGLEDLIEQFALRSPTTDGRTMGLALLAGLLDVGWNKALDAAEHPDMAVRERQAADLRWWVAAAEVGLAALG